MFWQLKYLLVFYKNICLVNFIKNANVPKDISLNIYIYYLLDLKDEKISESHITEYV